MATPEPKNTPTKKPSRLRVDPLAPTVYLQRNASKTLPLFGVIILAVMLICGIVSLINSIPLSIKVIYSYSQEYMGVTPRGDASATPRLKTAIQEETPVPLDRIMTVRGANMEVKSIVGAWPFVVLGLEQDDIPYYIERQNGGEIQGRIPAPLSPEVLISEPVARNLNLKIGDTLLGPELDEAHSPNEVKVVGIVSTDRWLAISNIEYMRLFHPPPIDALLVFAQNPSEQEELGIWASERFKGEQARIFTYTKLEEQADTMFNILYQILNVIIGTLVVVITLMMGMLINIFLSQRVQEFGLLQALGYTKRKLLSRVVAETLVVIFGGWFVGLAVAFGLLNLVKAQLMDPKAFALNTLDQSAYLYTIPIPVAILTVAVFTILAKFKKFDPVGVVERRLV